MALEVVSAYSFSEIFKNPAKNFVNPEIIDIDRFKARKPPGEGIEYTFLEQQDPQTHLFPRETELCSDLLKNCESYLDRKDVFKIRIAMALSLYGHQGQFRKSGEPYMIHPFAIAKEAAEVYKADWQTIALCLLHDLAEDSPKYGHEVKSDWVANIYKEIGYKEDGRVLAKSMEIMSKITGDTEMDGLPKDVATVRKLYDVLLSVVPDDYGLLRVLLVKLLDRKHNLQTIQYVPEDKRNAVLDETLRVYVNMAGALHLYKLQDDLVALSMIGRHPKNAEYVNLLREVTDRINGMRNKEPFAETIEQLLIEDGFIKRWWSNSDCFVQFQIPRMYEVYLNMLDKARQPIIRFQIIIPQKSDEVLQDWIDKAQACFDVLQQLPSVSVVGSRQSRLTFKDDKYRSQRVLQADITFFSTEYKLEFTGFDYYLSEQASLLHLFSHSIEFLPDNPNMRQAVFSHIGEMQQNYRLARDSGLLTTFFEAVSGPNTVEWQGVDIRFPENASVIDVLYSLIGQDVFRIHSVRIRSSQGRDYMLSGDELYARLSTGGTLIEYMTIPEPFSTITPSWLDYVSVGSVKDAVRNRLELLSRESASMRERVIERGQRRLLGIYGEVWNEMLEKDRRDGIEYREYELAFKFLDEAQVFSLPDKKLLPAISAEFPDTDEFIFQLGLDRVGEDVLASVREAYLFFRQNRIAIEIPVAGNLDPEKLSSLIRNRGISLLDSRIVETDNGYIMYVWFSTEELGGKKARDIFHNLKNLLFALRRRVRPQDKEEDPLPFYVYLRSTDDELRRVLKEKGHSLNMKIMHND